MSLLHRLEPGARAYVERLIQEGGKSLPELGVEDARRYMRESQSTPLEHASVSVALAKTADVALTIVRPAEERGPLPAVLYMHGGGWVLGGIETHASIVREIALRSRAVVVFPEYALSPEVRFPVAVEQCYEAARWVEAHGAEYGIDGRRLAVAGDSAGGNLAASVALLAVLRGGPALRLQVLMCPVMQASPVTGSYAEFAEGLNLTREAMAWFWSKYMPEGRQQDHPAASLLEAPLEALSRVAPAVVITAECDVLRDEGEQYAQRLMAAGVAVTGGRFFGTIHNFTVIDALRESGPAGAALAMTGDVLRTALYER